jgi:hypothetical protein
MPRSAFLSTMKVIREIDPIALFMLVCLVMLDGAAWWGIIGDIRSPPTRFYFLSQGATIVAYSGGAIVMTDAGPDQKIFAGSANALANADGYIDLAIISDPEPARFGGYLSILDHYRVGAFLYNGRNYDGGSGGSTSTWFALMASIRAHHIPLITVKAGDSIRYRINKIEIASPNNDFIQSADVSDAALVQFIHAPPLTALLAPDVGANVKNAVIKSGIAGKIDLLQGDAFLTSLRATLVVSNKVTSSNALSSKYKSVEIWAEGNESRPKLHVLQ